MGPVSSLLASELTLTCSGNGCGRQGQAAVPRKPGVFPCSLRACVHPGPAWAPNAAGCKTTGPRAQLCLLNPPGPTCSPPSPFMGQSRRGHQSCHLDQRSPLPREPRRAARGPADRSTGSLQRLPRLCGCLFCSLRWRWARYTARELKWCFVRDCNCCYPESSL